MVCPNYTDILTFPQGMRVAVSSISVFLPLYQLVAHEGQGVVCLLKTGSVVLNLDMTDDIALLFSASESWASAFTLFARVVAGLLPAESMVDEGVVLMPSLHGILRVMVGSRLFDVQLLQWQESALLASQNETETSISMQQASC